MEELNACLDNPSSLDFKFGSVDPDATMGLAVPDEYSILPPSIYDQSKEYVMRMSCTRCSVKHIVDAQNYEVSRWTGKFEPVDVEAMWRRWLDNHSECESRGDWVQNGPKQAIDEKLITAYAEVSSIEEAKQAIYTGRLIATGSQDGDWKSVRDKKLYAKRTDGKIVGHAFCLVGWNKDGFLAVNSYGDGNGIFLLPYSLADSIYTCYALFDATDVETIKSYKQSIMSNISIEDAKKAYENKIWNGERPQETVTREEAASMVYRAILSLNK